MRAILTDTEVIAVDQDRGGRRGSKVSDDGETEIWARPMSDRSVAVILLNRGRGPVDITTSPAAIGVKAAGGYTVRDLWKHTGAGTRGAVKASVPTHAVAMSRVWPEARDGKSDASP